MRITLLAVALATLSVQALPQDACLEWSDQFGVAGTSGAIEDAVTFDDGGGPALFVVGDFEGAGQVAAGDLARWDGSAWSSPGTEFLRFGSDAEVSAAVVFDDGSGAALYVGGNFTSVNGIPASLVARWDGATWSGLATGPGSGIVFTMCVYDDGSGDALYVGETANGISKWDGASWSVPGGGLGAVAQAMVVYDDGSGAQLYVGGNFLTAGAGNAKRIARWNGTSWSNVKAGCNALVRTLEVHDAGGGPLLYVGGQFTSAGPTSAQYLATWDGTSWAEVPGWVPNDEVLALRSHDDGSGPALYFAANFVPGGTGVGAFDGTNWTVPGGGLAKSPSGLFVYDEGAGARLFGAGLMLSETFHIRRWDGIAWSSVGAPGAGFKDGAPQVFAVHDDGGGAALYAGGDIADPGNLGCPEQVASWDGTAWSALADGPGAPVSDLVSFDDGSGPALYAAGGLTFPGPGGLSRWDGASWDSTGLGATLTSTKALLTFGGSLYAAGSFSSIDGVAASRIARWDGAVWSALGAGMDNTVYDLVLHDDGTGTALYAAGNFQNAGGLAAKRVARWNGASWSAVGSGISGGSVFDLASFGGVLYAGGNFQASVGAPDDGLARWDGSSWSALPNGALGAGFPTVGGFSVHNDGVEDALWIAGDFDSAGGLPASNLAKWNGSEWSVPEGAPSSKIQGLFSYDDGNGAGGPSLFLGGDFGSAGPYAAVGVAALRPSYTCFESYCTAGTSTSGCQALLSATGTPSATASSGFALIASGVEGLKDGTFFFGSNGRQANSWGSGTSFQCVVPPVVRTGLLTGAGAVGQCDGSFALDMNALWCPACPKPTKNPGAGATIQAQLWYRDPFNTSNQTTSLSDALEFTVAP